MSATSHLAHVYIEGFRSIDAMRLSLSPGATLLVGRNGAGKSTIINAISFVRDAVVLGLQAAIKKHGGIDSIRRKNAGAGDEDTRADVRLELQFRDEEGREDVGYGFTLGSDVRGGWYLKEEWCSRAQRLYWIARVDDHVVAANEEPPHPGSLLLPVFNGDVFKRVMDLVTGFFAYDIQLEALRQAQPFESDSELDASGHNLFHVWDRLSRDQPETFERVTALLASILPGLEGIRPQTFRSFALIEADFRLDDGSVLTVDNTGLSDGTLRAFALLVAAYQADPRALIMVEEPEISLHPKTATRLFNAMLGAPSSPQLLLSTHSPFILDDGDVHIDDVRVVEWSNGETLVGEVAEDQREDLRDHLVTRGELLEEGSFRIGAGFARPLSLRPSAMSSVEEE